MPRKRGNGPGHGGPAQGEGWGGPAKGAGVPGKNAPFEADNKAAEGHGRPLAEIAEQKRLSEAERAQVLKDHLYSLATGAARDETQVRAAEAWLNRHEGMPVARNVNFNLNEVSTLSDADLDAEIVRLATRAGSAGADAAGEAPPRLPKGSSDLVH